MTDLSEFCQLMTELGWNMDDLLDHTGRPSNSDIDETGLSRGGT